MDLIPSEMFRGHLDTIILLSLVNDDKHTNQIREEIEERSDGKFELKQGTFYSCLQRIVKQGYVTEYRATSTDGVRRKFLQLTEKGKNYIDDNKDKWEVSRSVVNVLLETPEKLKEKQNNAKPTAVSDVKTESAQEPFDIDKALKDFLSSDDVKTTKSDNKVQKEPLKTAQNDLNENEKNSFDVNKVADKVTEEKPFVKEGPISENVTIIDFSDIAEKSFDNKTTDSINQPKQVEFSNLPYEKPSKSEKQLKDFPTTDIAKSPEEYDLLTLVGIDESKSKSVNVLDEPFIEKVHAQSDLDTHNESQKVQFAAEDNKESVKSTPITPSNTERQTANPNNKQQLESQAVQQNFFADVNNNTQSAPQKTFENSPIVSQKIEEEDDFYSGQTPIKHDYKEVLGRIFPKHKSPEESESREMVYVQGTDINDYFNNVNEAPKTDNRFNLPYDNTDKTDNLDRRNNNFDKNNNSRQDTRQQQANVYKEDNNYSTPEVPIAKTDGYDFSDIQSLAKVEGFKVSIASASTKRKVNSILINKLTLISSLTFYAFCLIEIFLLAHFTAQQAGLTTKPFIIFAIVLAIFPITMLVIYFIDPKRKVASIATMKSVIELCIVIMLNLVLITIVFSILSEIDFSSTADLLKYILYPIIVILNVPVYFIIKYLNLENQKFYK